MDPDSQALLFFRAVIDLESNRGYLMSVESRDLVLVLITWTSGTMDTTRLPAYTTCAVYVENAVGFST